ncbi:hypothetical protein GCM10009863_18890 [Streptomyces axinellae]|uniref:Uncharacterized protein n=1 Tax=Streptomyces axinellae TaxID=552788 RepID=A0ABN3PXM9_9ACTN
MKSQVAETTEACRCLAKDNVCQDCKGEGWVTPLPEDGRRRDATGRCTSCAGRGGHRLPHEPTCPVMQKHPRLEYFAPQLISDSGDITFFSTGNALARPEVRQRLAQMLFGPRP